MEIKAQLKNARIVPRRALMIRGVVVGLPAQEAHAQLTFEAGKAAKLVDKVLMSALANAKENFDIEEDNLMVANVDVDEGVKFKRFRPVAKGSAHRYTKRTCHIRVILKEIKESSGVKKKKKTEVETLTVKDLEKMSAEDEGDKSGETEAKSRKNKGESGSKEMSNRSTKASQGRTHRRKAI
jgi:large subunit ribosomal protein L22